MKRYNLIDKIAATVVFLVAWATYLLTIEPTASFWDCPEFIACAFKLDVGHPPGAPFFMLAGKVASLFASDVTKVAMMVNALSATFSALTILFLFLTITHLARKTLGCTAENISLSQAIGVTGAGAVGALAYTFSDTFWFSAVEGEVYAFSSLFTAVVFWAILKWEDSLGESRSDRWLVFIAYMMGLSIGVHLLNLLAIPAIVLVFYFRKYEFSWRGMACALLVSCLLLGVMMYGFIPGSIEVASWFELLFVNQLHYSYNSGALVYFVLTVAVLCWAIFETYSGASRLRMNVAVFVTVILLGIPFVGSSVLVPAVLILALLCWLFVWNKTSQRLLHLVAVCLAMLFVGYSCYVVTIVRSLANPSMSQNSPDNVFALRSYLSREQYGDTPLIYGQCYNAELKLRVENDYCYPVMEESTVWSKDTVTGGADRYVSSKRRTPVYDSKFCSLFPRMYSSQSAHVEAYKAWADIKGTPVPYDRCGRIVTVMKPTFGENLRFFFKYQLGFMYGRYFMWNFSGRQNDIQGNGEVQFGNWITGFDFIDSAFYGDQTTLPAELADNKGRNKYYMLPLLLGILGILFQLNNGKRGKQGFAVTSMLFLLTGIAIVVYLNQTPYQPRERDYAYAGSFYAFCIWIGLGVLWFCQLLDGKHNALKAAGVSALCLFVPALMAQQNWDDHDRSGRYTCADFGYNYLMSCAPNAILFTYGDNDTFPLWYLQEVEGVRTDVRVCNLSYLQTDWYIDQMKRQYYESAPLPIDMPRSKYADGTRDYAYVQTSYNSYPKFERYIDEFLDLGAVLDFYKSDAGNTRDEQKNDFFPTKNLLMKIDTAAVRASGLADTTVKLNPEFEIELGNRVMKNEFLILEMLNNNRDWSRPIYYAVTVGNECNLGMGNFMRNEGLARRLVPYRAGGRPDLDIMYDNMMNKFRFGGISNPDIYLDENNLRMCRNLRRQFASLSTEMLYKGDTLRAKKVLDKCMKEIPLKTVPSDYSMILIFENYYKVGDRKTAGALMEELGTKAVEHLRWYFSLSRQQALSAENEIRENLYYLKEVNYVCDKYKVDAEMADFYAQEYERYYDLYGKLLGYQDF